MIDAATIGIIINAVTGSSVLAIYLQNRAQRRKVESDALQGEASASKSVVEAAGALIEIMKTDLQDLKKEVSQLRDDNFALRRRVFELEHELKKYAPTVVSQ